MADLSELIERLEKAERPNYQLEVDIFEFFNPEYADFVQGRGGLIHPNDGCDVRVQSDVRAPNYTASIDAAVALAVRVLPGWVFDLMEQDYETDPIGYRAFGWTVELINGVRVQGQSPTLPVAILIAVLRALSAREGR